MIAAGLGCRSGCAPADIVAAVARAVAASGLRLVDVCALYSAEFKAGEAGLREAASALDKPLVFLPEGALAEQAVRAATRSARVLARVALPSVAETSALAGAFELGRRRSRAELLSPRHVAGGATCALARVEADP